MKAQEQLHFLVTNASDLTKETQKKYFLAIDEYLDFVQNANLDWRTSSAIQEFYNFMRAEGVIKTQTANGKIFALRRVFEMLSREPSYANLEKIADINLTTPEEKEERGILTEDQAKALLLTTASKTPRDIRDRAVLVVGLETGMRRMSLAGMEWEKINWQLEKYQFGAVNVPIKGRGGKKRHDVPLSPVALAALRPWEAWCKKKGVTSGFVFRQILDSTKQTSPNPQIDKDPSKGLSNEAIYEIVKKRSRQANLDIIAHELRHTFIQWRRMAGVSDPSIAMVTGHVIPGSQTMAILDVYSHIGLAQAAISATPKWLPVMIADS